MNLDDDVFGFNAIDVVTMLTAMEAAVRATENVVEHGTNTYSKTDMDRFIEMLDRRRDVLNKVKYHLRSMNVNGEQV